MEGKLAHEEFLRDDRKPKWQDTRKVKEKIEKKKPDSKDQGRKADKWEKAHKVGPRVGKPTPRWSVGGLGSAKPEKNGKNVQKRED